MALLLNIRSHHRARQIRVRNSAGALVVLRPDVSTTVDVDDPAVRTQLGHHTAVGQWYTVSSSGGGGGPITLTSPDTLTTLTLGIDNSGNLVLT